MNPLLPERFFPWIQTVAQHFGIDMLRMKGIIAFEDDDDRYVMQGVHMLLEGNHQRAWKPDEKRLTRIVFIGQGPAARHHRGRVNRCVAGEQSRRQ